MWCLLLEYKFALFSFGSPKVCRMSTTCPALVCFGEAYGGEQQANNIAAELTRALEVLLLAGFRLVYSLQSMKH